MNDERLRLTEEKIRELVPRLKELSFGGEVYSIKGGHNDKVIRNIESVREIEVCQSQRLIELDEFKVIGHPIDLEAVLEVMGSLKMDKWGWAIDTGGYFIKYCQQRKNWVRQYHYGIWKHGKPLSKQSQETQKFIANLLDITK